MNIRLIVIVGLLAMAAVGCGQGSRNGKTAVDLAEVETRDIVVAAEATGVIEPIQVIEIKSKASGEIVKMAVETGQVVEKGDLLVQVDPTDLENALEQAKADLEVAEASLKVATAQKERSDKLLSSGMISEQQHEETTLAYATAQAQLIKAKRSLELAEERLDDTTVRAPSSGTVLSKYVEEGHIISSATSQVTGGTVLLTMADLSAVQVRTLVDETDIGSIEPGLPASMTVEAYRDREFLGMVLKVEPVAVVEQNVTMFPVLTQIPNEEGLLKPGMNADVEIQIRKRPAVRAVPVEAVRSVREMAILAPLVGLEAEEVMGTLEAMRRGPEAGERGAGKSPEAAGGSTGEPGGGGAQGGRARDTAHGRGTPGQGESGQPESAAGEGLSNASPQDSIPGGMARAGRPGGGTGSMTGGGPPGGMRPGGSSGMGSAGSRARGSGGVNMGLAFVKEGSRFVPRLVRTGATDWEFVEIISGLEEGEEVALLPSAQLYMQREEMMERFRSRSSVVGGGRR